MTRRFIIRPQAERDIQSAYDWYESQEPGVGERFLEAVRKRLEAIRDFPESCPIIYRDVRRAVVARFPTLSSMLCNPLESRFSLCFIIRGARRTGRAASLRSPARLQVSSSPSPFQRFSNASLFAT